MQVSQRAAEPSVTSFLIDTLPGKLETARRCAALGLRRDG
jgi:hypothetical protein